MSQGQVMALLALAMMATPPQCRPGPAHHHSLVLLRQNRH